MQLSCKGDTPHPVIRPFFKIGDLGISYSGKKLSKLLEDHVPVFIRGRRVPQELTVEHSGKELPITYHQTCYGPQMNVAGKSSPAVGNSELITLICKWLASSKTQIIFSGNHGQWFTIIYRTSKW